MKIWHGLAGFVALQLGGCPFLFDTNICGDGDVDAFEECDDGNASNDDACLNTCVASFCGDGFLQPGFGEQCDDGNFVNGDGCDAACFDEGGNNCGDGIVDAVEGEECDDGNDINFDGCATNCTNEPSGDVLFDYVLLQPGPNAGEIEALATCIERGVSDIRFMVGNDLNGDDILDDNEILQNSVLPCNQEDTNGNGTIEAAELGAFIDTLFAGSFDLFAIEFLGAGGTPIPWETFDTTIDAERFSFGGGFTVTANANNFIPFNADPQFLPQLAQELQAFFGF